MQSFMVLVDKRHDNSLHASQRSVLDIIARAKRAKEFSNDVFFGEEERLGC